MDDIRRRRPGWERIWKTCQQGLTTSSILEYRNDAQLDAKRTDKNAMQPTRRITPAKQTSPRRRGDSQPQADDEGLGEQPQNSPSTPSRQRKFMFVPASGRAEAVRNNRTRRTMRAHVMHNYLEKKDGKELAPSELREQPVTGGEKMKFRLTSDGLERRYPYRYGRSNPDEDRQDSADAGPSTRPGSMITYQLAEHPDLTLEALALFTGTSTVLPTNKDYVLEEAITFNSPLLGLGLGHMDPVGVLPFDLNPVDEALLSRFRHYERWPWCPIGGPSLWGPFAMTDKLVWHATMYSCAVHFRYRFIGDAGQQAAILRHKTLAIAIINTRIAQPEFATRDETLAAVATITNSELWFGDADDAQKHMNGLHALVTLRGGINTLTNGVQRLIQRLICWNDLVISQLYGVPMKFPPTELWSQKWRLQDQPSLGGSPAGLAVSQLRAAGIMPHEIVSVIHSIRQLCYAEMISPVQLGDNNAKMVRLEPVAYLERKMQSLHQTPEISTADGLNPEMWKVVSLISEIYVSHWLRGSPLYRPTFGIWVRKLHRALSKLTPGLQEMNFAPSMLIWVRAVAAVASETDVLGDWFLESLAQTCITWGLNWESFRWNLEGFLWIGDRDETIYARLWERVENNTLSVY